MIGQSFGDDIAEVLILVRHRSGREDGWVINEPSECSWQHAGLTASGSAVASVTVKGEFYRRAKDASSRRIEAGLHEALGGGAQWMLEEGDDG